MPSPLFLFFAQAEGPKGPASPAGGGMFETLIFAGLIFGVLYFLMIRPQKKKDQERRQMLEKVRRGDRVVTIGGVHGEVENVKDDHLILLIDPDHHVTIKVNRSAIHTILSSDSAEGSQK